MRDVINEWLLTVLYFCTFVSTPQGSRAKMEYISWANDIKKTNGRWREHVSFSSFVKRFHFTNKKLAISQYEILIKMPKLPTGRRQRLRAAYDIFVKSRMDAFWSSWDKEQADQEFNVSCETVIKRTAVMAQRASLAASANGFSAVQADITTISTTGTDEGKRFFYFWRVFV